VISDAERALASGEQPGSATELLQAILRSQHRQEEMLGQLAEKPAKAPRKAKE